MQPASLITGAAPAGFIRRRDFGSNFTFGTATSAFQIEGSYSADGRGKSIFDTFAEKNDLFIPYGEDLVNHRIYFQQDVQLLKELGVDAYRFSFSWNRILRRSIPGYEYPGLLFNAEPRGGCGPLHRDRDGRRDQPSPRGIRFYHDLLSNLREAGIKPMVTLLHFDPPQAFEDEYFTFIRTQMVADFVAYADFCFKEFGSEVKYWITINEPWYVAYGGYIMAEIPPGYRSTRTMTPFKERAAKSAEALPDFAHSSLCPLVKHPFSSSSFAPKTSGVVPSPEPEERWPYLVTHHQLLAHGRAATLYKERYQQEQGREIGLNLVAQWYVPLEDTELNKEAARRGMDFMFGWVMEPLLSGEYPERMRRSVTPGHLPEFTPEERQMLMKSYDFVSLNYYTSMYVTHEDTDGGDYVLDRRVRFYYEKDGVPTSPVQGAAGWVYGYPLGLLEVLNHIKNDYNNPKIYITENGIDDEDDNSMTHWDSFHDQKRLLYLHDHLAHVKHALRQGANIQGYFVWSFLDNLELGRGFQSRFGITYVDYVDEGRRRIPKYSAAWYKRFLEN